MYPMSRGFGFTLLNPILISRVGIAKTHMLTSTTVNFRIYSQATQLLIYNFVIPKTNEYNGYYILDIPQITLISANYRIAVTLQIGDRWTGSFDPVAGLDSRITTLFGCWSDIPNDFPSAYGGPNGIQGGMCWINDTSTSQLTVDGAINSTSTVTTGSITGNSFIVPASGNMFIKSNGTLDSANYIPYDPLFIQRYYKLYISKYSTYAVGGATGNFNLIPIPEST